jgi:hypothetical protein
VFLGPTNQLSHYSIFKEPTRNEPPFLLHLIGLVKNFLRQKQNTQASEEKPLKNSLPLVTTYPETGRTTENPESNPKGNFEFALQYRA